MRRHEKKWALARMAAAVGVATALAAAPASALAEEVEATAPEGEVLELVAQVDEPEVNTPTVEAQGPEEKAAPVETEGASEGASAPVAVVDGTNTATTTENDVTVATSTEVDNTEPAAQSTLEAQAEPRKGHWVVTDSYGQGLQRYFVWDDTGELATSELVGPENGAGYYAWATADGYILRGKWDSGAGRVYVADNDGRLVGSLLEGDEDGWVVTDKFDKGSMQRYWVDAKTRAACSGFFTIDGYGDCFGKGGQGYIVRGDFKFGGRLWSADNDGKLRSGWYVTSGFGQGLQRYWMGDTVFGSPHAAAVSRLVDASTPSKAWFAWATADGYVLRGKWDNGAGRVYVADNDGRLLGSDLSSDGWVITKDFDRGMQRYRIDASMRAAISGFFTVAGYGDCFGLGGQGYVLRGTMPFRDAVILADNDGKLPSEAGWLSSSAYGQGEQRYWIEVIYSSFLGTKPGYSEEGGAHYTLPAGYVLCNQIFYLDEIGWLSADDEGILSPISSIWTDIIEKYVTWALGIANDDSHGYSQPNRWGPEDYDCSSLVITALREAGLNTGSATYTGNMKSELCKHGWEAIRYNGDPSMLQRGDILLHEENHTEIYLGNNQRVGAHCDENGSIYGPKKGDQTGTEISVRDGVGTWFVWVLRLKTTDDSTGVLA